MALVITLNVYMILSFASSDTEKVWSGERVRKWPVEIQETARRKLRMLNSSVNIADLRIPPANRLEKLAGNLAGYYSIRINNQWRIIFCWESGHATQVEIIDYH